MLEAMPPYTYALFTRMLGWSRIEIEALLAGIRKELRNTSHHLYTKVRIVYGQKSGWFLDSGHMFLKAYTPESNFLFYPTILWTWQDFWCRKTRPWQINLTDFPGVHTSRVEPFPLSKRAFKAPFSLKGSIVSILVGDWSVNDVVGLNRRRLRHFSVWIIPPSRFICWVSCSDSRIEALPGWIGGLILTSKSPYSIMDVGEQSRCGWNIQSLTRSQQSALWGIFLRLAFALSTRHNWRRAYTYLGKIPR